MTSVPPFNLDLAPLLDWDGRHGDLLQPRAAEAVVGLLALSGARRRTGLPEPSAELVEELMLVLLPLYVSAGPADLAGYPAVLVALIGYTHAAGKLNAKRRDRLIAEVETLRPQFESAMTSPRRVTWARLYGQLLRPKASTPPIRGPSAPGWMPWRAVLTRSGTRHWGWRPPVVPVRGRAVGWSRSPRRRSSGR